MIIPSLNIEQGGPGIDLSEQPDGVTIAMSDPVTDFEYALNAVTLTYDLVGAVNVQLGFSAMEYGDEPHYPKSELGIVNSENEVGFGPIGSEQDFDGVAISVDWYEIQDLRHLRSDKFTGYNLYLAQKRPLLDPEVVDCYGRFDQRIPFFRGLAAWMGFENSGISFQSSVRIKNRPVTIHIIARRL